MTFAERRIVAVILAIAALLATGAAGRHGTIGLIIHSDGAGSVWATATWEDGHPVDGPVAATLLAVSDSGERIGPAALTRVAGAGALVLERALAAGTWRVVVDVAAPGIGHCEATVRVGELASRPASTVGQLASPSETRCVPPALATGPASVAAGGDGIDGDGPAWVWVGVGLALVGAAAASIVALIRRSKQ